MMILKINIKQENLSDSSKKNQKIYFDIFKNNIFNEEPLKSYNFEPKEQGLDKQKEMFNFILENIHEEWTIDNESIINDNSIESTIALKYSEILNKEINDIKNEIKNISTAQSENEG